jgi:hypothetical protein
MLWFWGTLWVKYINSDLSDNDTYPGNWAFGLKSLYIAAAAWFPVAFLLFIMRRW